MCEENGLDPYPCTTYYHENIVDNLLKWYYKQKSLEK